MRRIFFLTLGLVLGAGLRGESVESTGEVLAAREREYRELERQIKHLGPGFPGYERLRKETLRPDALILAGDRDPADVVLMRTAALLRHLERMAGAPDLSREQADLHELASQCAGAAVTQADARKDLFHRLCALRRRVALKNPLLDFDRIVFLTKHRPQRGDHHMVDQYYGFNARPGGGVHVLTGAFGERPEVQDLLAESAVGEGPMKGRGLQGGAFNTLDLDYDGKTILFAWSACAAPPADADWDGQPWGAAEAAKKGKPYYHWHPQTVYHIFKAGVDGAGLKPLTDGMWHDFDPCFLPDGRIAFISERRGGYLRCGGNRPNPTYTLYGMERDGRDIHPLSFHETQEWNPSVDNSGMIVYTRWDYVDRDSDIAHHIWHCYPDGRDPRGYHGNYPRARELRPWMELSIRAIPDSTRYVAVAAPHHGYNYGSLVLIDRSVPDDGAMSQVKRITPEAHFPESEAAPGVPHGKGRHSPSGEVYGTPWPLSEDFYLCVYDPDQRNYGIFLLDSFGNRILIYRDPAVACLDPIPLRARRRPPVIPVQTARGGEGAQEGAAVATVAVLDVYDSDYDWPDGLKVKTLRVIQLFPKTTYHLTTPMIGVAAESLARGVLGVVPVEADGSAYFELPAGVPVYFQALDERGLAIQSMRSLTYAHAGERLTCAGCHEPKWRAAAPRGAHALALKRPPSKLREQVVEANPVSFPRLVQPVLDRNCVTCHRDNRGKRAPDLSGDTFGAHGWSTAFHSLAKHAWRLEGGNGVIFRNGMRSTPGRLGARESGLFRMLEKGHHDVKLSEDDRLRITTWLDCNSNFYGVYHDTDRQARGERVMPVLE